MWAQEITLESDTTLSSEGYFVLSWTSAQDESTPLLLQQSSAESFSSSSLIRDFTIPANGSITITGLEDGQYYFRAGLGNTAFSNVVLVEVAHHSLQRAFTFFSIGLVLFLILLVTILKGRSGLKESGDA